MTLPLEPLWLNWFLLALLLICLDLLLGSGWLNRLGLAALLAALASRLLGDELWPLPLALFALLALLGWRLARKFPRKFGLGRGKAWPTRRRASQVGRQITLSEPLRGGLGALRLDGVEYLVRGPELPAGTVVVVLEQQGGSLLVERADRV